MSVTKMNETVEVALAFRRMSVLLKFGLSDDEAIGLVLDLCRVPVVRSALEAMRQEFLRSPGELGSNLTANPLPFGCFLNQLSIAGWCSGLAETTSKVAADVLAQTLEWPSDNRSRELYFALVCLGTLLDAGVGLERSLIAIQADCGNQELALGLERARKTLEFEGTFSDASCWPGLRPEHFRKLQDGVSTGALDTALKEIAKEIASGSSQQGQPATKLSNATGSPADVVERIVLERAELLGDLDLGLQAISELRAFTARLLMSLQPYHSELT